MIYYVQINDKEYEVEVEKGKAEVLNVNAVVSAQAQPSLPKESVEPATPTSKPVVGDGEAVAAPMPGTVLEVKGTAGQTVKAGDVIVVLEAMKMENEILAPKAGVLTQLPVAKGATVDTGDILFFIK